MKKIILLIAVLVFRFADAQVVKFGVFGVKFGANFSNIKDSSPAIDGETSSEPDSKALFGFHIGGFAHIGITEKFAFQPELLYSIEGAKSEFSESDSDFSFSETSKLKLSYINIPLLAKYYATEELFFTVGPQIGILMSAKSDSELSITVFGETTSESSNEDVKDAYKSINFSGSIGAGYNFSENIFAEVRYIIGLSNISESQKIDTGFGEITYEPVTKLNNFQISFGYKF
jgi:hypothetical protein